MPALPVRPFRPLSATTASISESSRPASASTSRVCSPSSGGADGGASPPSTRVAVRTRSSGPTVGCSTLTVVPLPARFERLEHAADLSGRHAFGGEQLDPLVRRTRGQRALELGGELGAVLDAAGVRGEPLVGEQVVPPEHAAELREQPVVGGRDRDQAVLRLRAARRGRRCGARCRSAPPPRR